MAAVLSCGAEAVLSHGSAAALWGIGAEYGDWIEVSIRLASPRRGPGLLVRRRPSLRCRDVTAHKGIPVTSVAQTLVDYAATHGPQATERAINEADRLDLIDPDSLRIASEDHCGQPGVRSLRRILDRRTFRLTDSHLEQLFLPLCGEVGLPRPLTRQHLNGFRVDFYWPQLDLVVETDGLRHHRTPSQQARDHLRDQAHLAAGLTSLRFTHEQVRYQPDHVRKILRSVASRLREGRAS